MRKKIKLNCPGCQRRLKVAAKMVGKRMQCNQCNDIFYLKKVSEAEYNDYYARLGAAPDDSEVIELESSEEFDDLPIAELA